MLATELPDDYLQPPHRPGSNCSFGARVFCTVWRREEQQTEPRPPQPQNDFLTNRPTSASPKQVLSEKLKALVDAGKITNKESIELYLTAFPEEIT